MAAAGADAAAAATDAIASGVESNMKHVLGGVAIEALMYIVQNDYIDDAIEKDPHLKYRVMVFASMIAALAKAQAENEDDDDDDDDKKEEAANKATKND